MQGNIPISQKSILISQESILDEAQRLHDLFESQSAPLPRVTRPEVVDKKARSVGGKGRRARGGSPRNALWTIKLLSRIITMIILYQLLVQNRDLVKQTHREIADLFRDLPGVAECKQQMANSSTFLTVLTETYIVKTSKSAHCTTLMNSNKDHWRHLIATLTATISAIITFGAMKAQAEGKPKTAALSTVANVPFEVFVTLSGIVENGIKTVFSGLVPGTEGSPSKLGEVMMSAATKGKKKDVSDDEDE